MFRTSVLLIPLLLLLATGCERKLSPEAQAAQEAAKTADQRVALLEKELADIKAERNAPKDSHPEDVKHLSAAQQKALERQLADAKRKAEAKKKEALELEQQPAPAPAPAAAALPVTVTVEVPTGTRIVVKPTKELSTEKDRAGDAWEGTLAEDVVVGGQLVWVAGKPVRGVIAQSTAAGRLSTGQGALAIKLTEIGDIDVEANTHVVSGGPKGERNAKMIGGGAALGALVGILSSGRNKSDHALGGAAVGAAVGTAVAAGTADTVIRIKPETAIVFNLSAPERVVLRKN